MIEHYINDHQTSIKIFTREQVKISSVRVYMRVCVGGGGGGQVGVSACVCGCVSECGMTFQVVITYNYACFFAVTVVKPQ